MNAESLSSDHDNGADHDTGKDHDADEVLLDVRPIIERGDDPFGTIMQTVATLDGRSLLLVAPFEPTPLQGVLSAQGFSYESERVSDTEWRVRFEPAEEAAVRGAPREGLPLRRAPLLGRAALLGQPLQPRRSLLLRHPPLPGQPRP